MKFFIYFCIFVGNQQNFGYHFRILQKKNVIRWKYDENIERAAFATTFCSVPFYYLSIYDWFVIIYQCAWWYIKHSCQYLSITFSIRQIVLVVCFQFIGWNAMSRKVERYPSQVYQKLKQNIVSSQKASKTLTRKTILMKGESKRDGYGWEMHAVVMRKEWREAIWMTWISYGSGARWGWHWNELE